MLDSLKPIQFGFFGSLGSFFPKKLPKSGCGVKPRIYNSRTVGARGGASHIYLFPWSGCGAAPHIYLSLMSGCGAGNTANTVPLRVKPQGGISYFFVFINPRRGKTLRHISEASAAFSTSGRIYGTTQYVRALTNPAAALPFEYTSANQTVPTA